MRKNPWLIQDCFSQFINEPYLASKYGQKEIQAASDWLTNTKIDVNMAYRIDKSEYPMVSVAMMGSSEIREMEHLGDLSPEVETLMPSQINKPIPYIIKPFIPTGYDPDQGMVYVDSSVDLGIITPGMVLINPDNGQGYVIINVHPGSIEITQDLNIEASRLAVVPQYPFYRVRREHQFFQESYSIGCHTVGDPSTLLWLHSAVVYILMRYREALLEGRNFAQSNISSSDFAPNQYIASLGGDNAYSRHITLTGQVENTWLKAPKRVIEAAVFTNTPDATNGFMGGIKIISQNPPSFLDSQDEGWTTIDD